MLSLNIRGGEKITFLLHLMVILSILLLLILCMALNANTAPKILAPANTTSTTNSAVHVQQICMLLNYNDMYFPQ